LGQFVDIVHLHNFLLLRLPYHNTGIDDV
jgi:hypothetical protein